jgi:hypothetical protein
MKDAQEAQIIGHLGFSLQGLPAEAYRRVGSTPPAQGTPAGEGSVHREGTTQMTIDQSAQILQALLRIAISLEKIEVKMSPIYIYTTSTPPSPMIQPPITPYPWDPPYIVTSNTQEDHG